jgi:uncharacterized SAM-binding protein YcdF (DUF218 family)
MPTVPSQPAIAPGIVDNEPQPVDASLSGQAQAEKPVRKRGAARKIAGGTGKTLHFLFKAGLVVAFLAGGAFIGGFVKYSSVVTAYDPLVEVGAADGIVVFTGGPERIQRAVDLLAEAKGSRLLISGVNPVTTRDKLKSMNPSASGLFGCCVDIGHEAQNTIGNAEETAEWAQRWKHKSLIVVTSDYHMPRSILELSRAMPGATFQPVAVPFIQDDGDGWYREPANLRKTLGEYIKLLVAQMRPAARQAGLDTVLGSLMK